MQKDLYNEKAIERLSNLSEKDKEKTIIFI